MDSRILAESPSIALLELYAIVMAVLIWPDKPKNQQIIFKSDSLTAVHVISKGSSSCKICLVLLHALVLGCMYFNIDSKCGRLPGFSNSDTLEKPQHLTRVIRPVSMASFRNIPL